MTVTSLHNLIAQLDDEIAQARARHQDRLELALVREQQAARRLVDGKAAVLRERLALTRSGGLGELLGVGV